MASKISLNLLLLGILALQTVVYGYDLAILHTNDIHGRIDPINKYGGPCPEDNPDSCFGGFARLKSKVKEMRSIHRNTLLLDAGNILSGSTWYFKYGGEGMATFMNYVGYDAMTLGSHEFAKGDEELIPFLDGINFTAVSANVELEDNSPLQGKFVKSHVTVVGGERIGIIGYTLTSTPEISNPADHVSFSDEVAAVREEVAKLTQQNVNKIIVIGHAGPDREMEIASQVEGIDIVVGGRSNGLFYNGEAPSNESPIGEYPQIVTQPSGAKVLVIHTYVYAKYLGELHLVFDNNGVITSWYGNPILLDSSVPEDSGMQRFLAPYRQELEAEMDVVVGRSNVYLEAVSTACRSRECNMGNLIADAFVYKKIKYSDIENHWNNVTIAIVNAGSIRASLPKGDITLGRANTVVPFASSIDIVEMYGEALLEVLEHSVSEHDDWGHNTWGGFLQVSGLKVEYDLFKPPGKRVHRARALCTHCDIPRYEDIRTYDVYQVIVTSFMARGGDRYDVIPQNTLRYIDASYLDLEIFLEYLEKFSPIIQGEEERIVFLTPKPDCETPGFPVSYGSAAFSKSYLPLLLAALFFLTL